MRVLADHLRALEAHLALIDEQIEAQQRSSATAQALEAQVAALEKAKADKEAHGEFVSERPGCCGA
jgi:hypothetical protein